MNLGGEGMGVWGKQGKKLGKTGCGGLGRIIKECKGVGIRREKEVKLGGAGWGAGEAGGARGQRTEN